MTMAQWAVALSQFVSRSVVDRTGLMGGFDDPQRGPAEVLVIDRAERPTED